jgi:DNA-binding NarL/FixJ family response regulator
MAAGAPLIKVLLVDDHGVVRDGLQALLGLESDMRVTASFGNADEALGYLEEKAADVVVLDVSLPGIGGIEAARRIHDICPGTQILMLSMHAGAEYVHQALSAGASGYVLKESAGAEVVAAVRAVSAGQQYLSGRISQQALSDYTHSRGERPLEWLSRRELQILKLIVEGSTSGEVGALLGISPKSVDTYRSRMMRKLGIGDLAKLVKFAIRHGVTSVE